uniref:hypothetical protein n=1 Tax=Paractinoplanes polyasparticus TaxID=2856853 RepID=UPI001C8585D9|nr:hypothetical protein [Actinoplanes polyasparticus]
MTEEKNDMTEDDRAVRILRTMPAEPPLPSTVDVPRTMAEGRRRRRVRTWSGGVALAAVTAAAAGAGTVAATAQRGDAPAPPVNPVTTTSKAPAPPPVPKDCKVSLLPTGGIKKALVTAGDPTGRYQAGRAYPGTGKVHTVVWRDGALLPVPKMPGDDPSFRDINSSGVAVGYSFEGDDQRAYVLEGDTVRQLRGGGASAAAINDRGVIAGALGDLYLSGVPVMWKSSRATPTRLPLPSGFTGGAAVDIADDGTVLGSISRKTGEGTAYLWLPDGTGRLLPKPGQADYFWADSISNGRLFGSAVDDSADGSTRRFVSYRYVIATGKYEKLATQLSTALGAENGWVLGTTSGPVILAGPKVVKLPAYKRMKEYQMTAFSADGRTAAGYTTDTTDTEPVANRPLKWTCR